MSPLTATHTLAIMATCKSPTKLQECNFRSFVTPIMSGKALGARCTAPRCRVTGPPARVHSSAKSPSLEPTTRLGAGHVQLAITSFESNNSCIRIVQPLHEDELIDWYIANGQENPPFWAIVWPSAVAMSMCILEHPELVSGKRVLDVGSGLGLAGISCAVAVAKNAGASSVTLLDLDPCALQCALLSASASGVAADRASTVVAPTSAMSFAEAPSERTAIDAFQRELMSTASVSTRDAGARACPVTAQVFDWGEPWEGGPVDVVLGADVLYDACAVTPLATRISEMLGRGGGGGQRVLLTDEAKRSPQNRRRFMMELAEINGEIVVEMNYTRTVSEGNKDVQMIVLRRQEGQETVGLPLSSVL